MDKKLLSALLFAIPLASYAAKPIDLNPENIATLSAFVSTQSAPNAIKLKEINRAVDALQMMHVRLIETYQGFPVVNAEAIVHIPNGAQTNSALDQTLAAAEKNQGSLDGMIYTNLADDLAATQNAVFTEAQAQKALQFVIGQHQQKINNLSTPSHAQSKLVVFVDKNNKAHWAYQISFYLKSSHATQLPSKPIYFIDATTFQVYQHWDTVETKKPQGGGFGGNKKMGKIVYDGLKKDFASLTIKRSSTTCSLANNDVTVVSAADSVNKKAGDGYPIETYVCKSTDSKHNNVYWDGSKDAVNDGYSPDNDALFGGIVIKNMYQDWYKIPVLVDDKGKPLMLMMAVHDPVGDNAFWDPDEQVMHFGDGEEIFYPLTSAGVAGHEISHGFTSQHSNLDYELQSGGMNEAFSDMADQAVEFYIYGKVNWQIGPEIFKAENQALRYMDQPSKDCNGNQPGDDCSIDNAKEYTDDLDVHYSSGVYNHFFYYLGTTKDWNVKKAFDVMVLANSSYWTNSSNFETGACGVLKAAKELKYNLDDVKKAFSKVDINTKSCKV